MICPSDESYRGHSGRFHLPTGAGERAAQKAKWGKQILLPHEWLMVLNEEMGELAKELWENKDRTKQVDEAVQVTAMAVQIAEWVSEMVGWENTTEQVVYGTLAYKQPGGEPLFCTWTTSRLYLKLMNEAGAMALAADQHSDKFGTMMSDWSKHVRNLIWLGYLLIAKLIKLKEGSKESI